jgi:hypothetical protein
MTVHSVHFIQDLFSSDTLVTEKIKTQYQEEFFGGKLRLVKFLNKKKAKNSSENV